MEIGSLILWRGALYVLVGVDPMNVPGRRAYLRELDDETSFGVPFDEIEEAPPPGGFASQP